MTNTNDNSNVVAIAYWKKNLSYRPLINYRWYTETEDDGTRYLTDSGAFPKFPARLYFNRCVKGNGVDQRIEKILISDESVRDFSISCLFEVTGVGSTTAIAGGFNNSNRFTIAEVVPNKITFSVIDINGDYNNVAVSNIENGSCIISATWDENKKEAKFYVNSIEVNETGTQYYTESGYLHLMARHNDTQYFDGLLSNVILIKDTVLTQSQITYLYNYPEKYLYRHPTGELNSYGEPLYELKSNLSSLDISKVVAYLPLCETDGFVRDMVGYSEGVDELNSIAPTVLNSDEITTFSSLSDNSFDLEVTTVGTSTIRPRVETTSSSGVDGSAYYLLDFDIVVNSGTCLLQSLKVAGTYYGTSFEQLNTGHHSVVVIGNEGLTANNMQFDGTNLFSISVTNWTVKKLTSIYKIDQFTNAVRDDAINGDKSLQTCLLKRTDLGVPYASSFDRLECDGVGYADAGWIPDINEDFIQELVFYNDVNTTAKERIGASNNFVGIYGNGYYYDNLFGDNVLFIGSSALNDGYNHFYRYWDSATNTRIMYINGVEKINKTITPTATTEPFYIGKRNGATIEFLKHPIRQFKVHSDIAKAPTPTESYYDAVAKGLLL